MITTSLRCLVAATSVMVSMAELRSMMSRPITPGRFAELSLGALRAGLDLVIAPGFSDYPDLRSVGFPSVLIANGLDRMPSITMDDGPYTGLFTQCCVDTSFAHTLYTYSGIYRLDKTGPHSVSSGGAASVLQQLRPA